VKRSSSSLLLLAGVVLLAFAGGLWQLFSLRFEAGDVYPPYSSLRADPLGTKALHDSLAFLDSRRVARHYRPLDKLDDPRNTTVLWLGDSPSGLPAAEWRGFIRGGGRLVVAWTPSQSVRSTGTNAPGRLPWQQAR